MKDTMNRVALELEGVKLENVNYFDKHYRSQTDYDWVSLYALGVHGIDWRLGGGFIEKCFKRTRTLRRYKGLMKINCGRESMRLMGILNLLTFFIS